MIFLKLLIGSLTFFAAAVLIPDEYSSLTLLNYIKPEHYNIKIIPFMKYKQNLYSGECNININILQDTYRINLHSDVERITDIELTNNQPEIRKDDSKRITYIHAKYVHDNETHIAEFSFLNKLSSGRYILNIKFFGTIADNGSFRNLSLMGSENIAWIAATHFQTIGARRLFPCWDKPELNATFKISIMHNPNYKVFSNMPVQKEEKFIMVKNISWTHFHTTPAMPTHLVAAVVANKTKLFYLSGGIETINIWCTNYASYHMSYAQSVVKNVTLYLESEWKRSEMIMKVDHIAIPNFQDEDIVNLGLVLYRESDILYNNEIDPIARKIQVAHLVGRKIVEEWFCNVFNSSWYPFSWLNEALVLFIGVDTIDKVLPNDQIMNLFVVQIQQDYFHLDADYSMWPFTYTNNSFEIPHYIKGMVSLRMLQHAISKKTFLNATYIYLHNNEPSYDVFQKAILDTYNQHKSNETQYARIYRRELLAKMIDTVDSWAKHKHYPIINIRRLHYYGYPISFIKISMQNYNTSNDYCIPLTFTTQEHCNFENTLPSISLTKSLSSQILELPMEKDSWIIFNIQQTGIYRVNYDTRNWQMILNYLNSENYANIHVLNRAQIIDDAFHLMIAGILDPSIFWNLTTYLYREVDFVAWYPMFKALEYMSSAFPLPDEKIGGIKKKIRNIGKILNVVLKRIKYEEIDDQDELRIRLRQEAAKWACILDDSTCKEQANRKLKQHLANPKAQRLLPWWKEWTYCNGLKTTSKNDSIWQSVYDMGIKKSETKLLEFLACSEDSNVIIDYLHLKNKQNITKSENQNFIKSYLFIIAKHAKNNDTLKHILENFNEIKPTQVSMAAALTIIINNLYSEDQLKQISEFMIEEQRKAKTAVDIANKTNREESEKRHKVLRDIEQLTPIIQSKIEIRRNQIESQIKYFQNY